MPDSVKKTGAFVPFLLDFSSEQGDSELQARIILETVRAAVVKGYPRVGITYGANPDQVASIHQAYREGKASFTDITGDNQARTLKRLHALLQEKELEDVRGKFYLLPITTASVSEENIAGEQKKDVAHIETFLKEGGFALGWRNSGSVGPRPEGREGFGPLALGGGVASQPFVSEALLVTQKELLKLEEQYRVGEGFDLVTYYDADAKKRFAKKLSQHTLTQAAPTQAAPTQAAPTQAVFRDAAKKVEVKKAQANASDDVVTNINSADKLKDNFISPDALEKIKAIKEFSLEDKKISLTFEDKLNNSSAVEAVTVNVSVNAEKKGAFEIRRQRVFTKDNDVNVAVAMFKAFIASNPGKNIIVTPKDAKAHEIFELAIAAMSPELTDNKANVLIKSVGSSKRELSCTYKTPVEHPNPAKPTMQEETFSDLTTDEPETTIPPVPKSDSVTPTVSSEDSVPLASIEDEAVNSSRCGGWGDSIKTIGSWLVRPWKSKAEEKSESETQSNSTYKPK